MQSADGHPDEKRASEGADEVAACMYDVNGLIFLVYRSLLLARSAVMHNGSAAAPAWADASDVQKAQSCAQQWSVLQS